MTLDYVLTNDPPAAALSLEKHDAVLPSLLHPTSLIRSVG